MSSLPPADDAFHQSPQYPTSRSNNALWIVLIVAAAALLVMCLIGGILMALLLPAVQQAREAARSSQSSNNLKMVGLAAHNFHDTNGRFPPLAPNGQDDPDVTAPISFNTALLPYLDQAALYGGIDKSIPWDDPINKMAYSTVVPTYISPHFEQRTDANGYAVTHYVPSSHIVVEDGGGIRLREVTDGTSNTILGGSIDNTAMPPWGDPQNARDPGNGFAGGPNAFGGVSGGAVILLMDGSVRFIDANTAPGVANALASPTGGEPVPAF